jgi:glycosyltransferase involved in cell wall biosynthesis
MKFCILFPFYEGAWGGGNQALKSLRAEFEERGMYVDKYAEADVVVFNSHHQLGDVLTARRRYPDKIFLHRIDGPISLIRGTKGTLDLLIYALNQACADGTIFQSNWSYQKNKDVGYKNRKPSVVVHNAPDKEFFFRRPGKQSTKNNQVRIIATSWSTNLRKGYDDYVWLDKHLDFSRYQFTFVGNTPVEFENILHIAPMPSQKLGEQIRNSDIYITASRRDPCSNSLVEAINCGLPAIGKNDGGHPELIQNGGLLYDDVQQVPQLLDQLSHNYDNFVENLPQFTIEAVADSYTQLAEMCMQRKPITRISIQTINKIRYYHFTYKFWQWALQIAKKNHRK